MAVIHKANLWVEIVPYMISRVTPEPGKGKPYYILGAYDRIISNRPPHPALNQFVLCVVHHYTCEVSTHFTLRIDRYAEMLKSKERKSAFQHWVSHWSRKDSALAWKGDYRAYSEHEMRFSILETLKGWGNG